MTFTRGERQRSNADASYPLIAVEPVAQVWLLALMTAPAVAMSAFLGWSLIANRRQCRICWLGHASNAVLSMSLTAAALFG
ncbi:MAG TPA: hypothetical protein VLD67_10350 [Vicinamibacterales bacterium]|nr:hypothetical protein [Vicinamibacterales bacterium]